MQVLVLDYYKLQLYPHYKSITLGYDGDCNLYIDPVDYSSFIDKYVGLETDCFNEVDEESGEYYSLFDLPDDFFMNQIRVYPIVSTLGGIK